MGYSSSNIKNREGLLMVSQRNTGSEATLGERTLQKVKWHLIPFAFLLYFFNNMDRVNIGYAALQMNKALHITSVQFGMITSFFFISYFLFQIPSNIIAQRVGIRKWIPTIIIVWGLITGITFFSHNATFIVWVRFLLGIAEAGFFPGMIYYFTLWFPARERAEATSLFMMAIAVSTIVASPISGWIVQHGALCGYDGWRWLFAFEGVITVILGFIAIFVFTNKPQDAKWLNEDEKQWLITELQNEQKDKKETGKVAIGKLLTNGSLWRLVLIYMFIQAAGQAASFWLPGIVKGFSKTFSDTQVGIIMMFPYILAAIAMSVWARHSDRTKERRYHAAIPMLFAGLAFITLMCVDNVIVKIIALLAFGIGSLSFYGPYWTFPPALLSAETIAAGVAIINSGSSIGAFGSNYIIGFISGSAWGTRGVFLFEALLCFVSFVLMVTIRTKDKDKA
jgi:ACS family tartrate transporter-like MFS transporter